MGLPEISIIFKKKAETAIARSADGIVAVILTDTTKSGEGTQSYRYDYESDIEDADWSTVNRDYLNKVFLGSPHRVIAERVGAEGNYEEALARLKNKNWDYLTIPGIGDDDVEDISQWIQEQFESGKTFQAVLPNCEANHEAIINFATGDIKVGVKTYTTAEYCSRIAGLLAGVPLNEGATYSVLPEVDGITESSTPDTDIDAGKLILVDDGENIKIARAVNSLKTLTGDKTEDMKKIKIIRGMNLIRDDIREAFETNYIGINNSYDNKQLFISAVNQYFSQLENEGVLEPTAENISEIDLDAQKAWLAERYDISDWSDTEIKTAKTGSYIFVKASITLLDCIEDLKFVINMQ